MRRSPLLALALTAACSGTPAPAPATPPPPTPPPPAPVAEAPAPGEDVPPAIDCPVARTLDPEALASEAACLLRLYVQVDTTNPPGNEVAATDFLTRVLARDGLDARVLESAPGRANLVARLPGARREGATVLMHHMDVVPADAEEWSVPPLSGEVRDGFVWGRGSLDNKGAGVAQALTLAMLKRLGIQPPRDLILLGAADEEAGGGLGARWLVEAHPELFEGVGAVLNEGGAILQLGEDRRAYSVEVAQKAPLWLRLTASGPSGHGSSPRPDAATHVLARALGRLEAYRFPVVVLPEVQAVFAGRAASMPPAQQRRYRDLEASLRSAPFRGEFLADPKNAALVQNTLSITRLEGSDAHNVLPGRASAVLDLRLLPGQRAEDAIAEVRRVIAEPSVEIETLLSWEAHTAPTDHPMVEAIRRLAAARHPGAPVAPNVIGGFTDCNAFRAKGIACYGFLPFELSFADIGRVHGRDERMSVAALGRGVQALVELVQIDCAGEAGCPAAE